MRPIATTVAFSGARAAASACCVLLGFFLLLVPLPARAEEEGAAREHEHGEEAQAKSKAVKVWRGFLSHLRSIGREDLIPQESLSLGEGESASEAHALKLESTDPVRGILFRLSKDLVNIDALFKEADGKPLEPRARDKAAELAAKLRAADDPYLRAYGDFFGAQLDLAAQRHQEAVKALSALKESPQFLPEREAQRCLVSAYRGAGDATLAVLELQLLLVSLPQEEETARAWAKEELRQISEGHPGPLNETGDRMRSISEQLALEEIGEPTQAAERRVEDVLTKVAQLLEAPRCPNCGTPYCPDCGKKRCACRLLPGKP